MTERERAINQDLRVLDEAHRLSRITRPEYRARRRRVLEALYDSNGVVTARKALVPPDALTAPRMRSPTAVYGDSVAGLGSGSHAMKSLLSIRPSLAWKPLLSLVAGVAALALLTWWLLRTQ